MLSKTKQPLESKAPTEPGDAPLQENKSEAMSAQEYLDLAGVVFIVLDNRGVITLANKKACDVFGELQGKNWFELHKSYKSDAPPHAPASFKLLEVQQVENFISPMQTKNGQLRIHEWHNAYIKDAYNRVVGVVITGKDVTEREQAVEALRESEQRYRSVVQTANDAILTIDNSGKIRSWNRAAEKIFGYTAEEIIGQSFLLLAPREFHDAHQKIFDQVLSGDVALPKKIMVGSTVRKDGSPLVGEFSVSIWKSGKELNSTVFVRDITERKEAEERLLNSEIVLKKQAQELTDMNTSLRVMLNQWMGYKKELEEKVSRDIQETIIPYLRKMADTTLDIQQKSYMSHIESKLLQIISSMSGRESSRYSILTPMENMVANLVKEGKRNKEIAETVNVSIKTVEFHRNNIRLKLGIKNQKLNLRSYLLSLK